MVKIMATDQENLNISSSHLWGHEDDSTLKQKSRTLPLGSVEQRSPLRVNVSVNQCHSTNSKPFCAMSSNKPCQNIQSICSKSSPKKTSLTAQTCLQRSTLTPPGQNTDSPSMSLNIEALPVPGVVIQEMSPPDGSHSPTPSQPSEVLRDKSLTINPKTMFTPRTIFSPFLKHVNLALNRQSSFCPGLSPMHASRNWNIEDETLPNCSGISCFEDTVDASCILPVVVEPSLGHHGMDMSHTNPVYLPSLKETVLTLGKDDQPDLHNGSNSCLSLLESPLPKAPGEMINASSFSRSSLEDARGIFLLMDSVNNADEDDCCKELHKGSHFCPSLQEGPLPKALGENTSLVSSSFSRSSLIGKHDLFEDRTQCEDSSEHQVKNLTIEVTVPAPVQSSSVAVVTDPNLTHIVVPDGEAFASCTVPLSCSLSSSLFDSGCDDKKTNLKNGTFECLAEPTLELKTGAPLNMVLTKPNALTTEIRAVAIRPLNGTFEACSPMIRSETPQETSVGNAIQTDPELKSTDVDLAESLAQPQPGPSRAHALSNSLCNLTVDLEEKNNTFTLDDTLELDPEILVTSTPMVTSKAVGKPERTLDVRKMLSSDFLPKPAQQPVASNIVTDRKLLQPLSAMSHPKSRLPPPRTVSQLPTLTAKTKTKPAHVASAHVESFSAIPGNRSKTRGGPLENVAATFTQQALADNTSSTLVNTVPESKLTRTGLMKSQTSGLQSGTRSCIPNLRIPTAVATRSTTKPSLSASLNRKSLQAPTQSQKHFATSSCAVPVAKRKKLDCPSLATSSNARKISARCGMKPATNLKATPAKKQTSGCANCVLLQQELEKCREELKCQKEKDN